MKAGDMCLQCSKELQNDPHAQAEKEGKKRYEVRDMLISPVEVRCIRCHRRLARNARNVHGPLRPVVGALGLVFWGCESIYGGVKGKLASSSDELQGTQQYTQHINESVESFETVVHVSGAPPPYRDIPEKSRN
ncbi:uncharacterized protein ZBAI_05216 [Zygosaccharomyces bailii ISA1307]|nr:uncharacterized protein ZBAI_05216 [Zygosaccharomyces bailii ISA1307]